jgi:D-beta-D-heptose 7-phosphate kinase/D-beta-D-heptose 1-phosphate adenosyltransferase
MMNVDPARLQRIVRKFKGRKVVVLGDIMLDKYLWGSVSRISPEAPVPVVEVKRDSLCLGGAGNVCRNLESLSAAPVLVGVVGKDTEGRWIRRNVPDSRGIIQDPGRPTTTKTRIVAHHQQVVRVDLERKKAVSAEMEEQVLNFIRKEECGGIVLSDYSKGMLTAGLVSRILAHAEANGIMVFVDPKVENFGLFTPVTLITPNHVEAEKIVSHECRTDAQVERAGEEILSIVRSRYLILKRGEQGMSVFETGRKPVHIPAIAREVFDVTGAGDTVIAAAALALLAGATILEAAVLANAAAGVVIGKIGTAAVTPEELLGGVRSQHLTFL